MPKQRDRSRILTPEALAKLEKAIRTWEQQNDKRLSQDYRWRELTSSIKPGGLDAGTLGKIRKGQKGADRKSIRIALEVLGLNLEEADLIAPPSGTEIHPPDRSFVGREEAIGDLDKLVAEKHKIIVIQAGGGVGKTTLARRYLRQNFKRDNIIEFCIAQETKDIALVENLLEEKLRQLNIEPGADFFISLDRFKQKLYKEKIGILIDNLEPALDASGRFITPHRRYIELMRVLCDPEIQSLTLVTSRERLSEPSISCKHYLLKNLDLDSWKKFFKTRLSCASDDAALSGLHKAYGGNAKAMEILVGSIQADFDNDVISYWNENKDDLFIEVALEDLVSRQFDRLQELDTEAYLLFCRMGCYRYQDVQKVPLDGLLSLLWDIDQKRKKRVIRSLKERLLIECEDNKFWLHPVIRAEAIKRLRESQDWQISHQKAAEYWTDSVELVTSIEDALTAFEAYYHYLEINDLENAGEVIIKPRPADPDFCTHLGSSFYRFGLAQQMLGAISHLVPENDHLYPPRSLSTLYILLGDQYWTIGKIHKAIESHTKSRELALKVLENESNSEDLSKGHPYSMNKRKVVAFLNLGLCNFDLGNRDESFYFFDLFEKETNQILDDKNSSLLTSFGFLAMFHAQKQDISETFNYIEKYEKLLNFFKKKYQNYSSHYSWNQALGLLLIGIAYIEINELEKGLENLDFTCNLAQDYNYKKLDGQAKVAISRIKCQLGDYSSALSYSEQAISLLNEVNAKAELAEAQFQLAITYRAMKELAKSHESFQEAIRLYTELEVPKQIERIQQGMEN
jgi:tetratricopeptide (TPR) repeat protein